VKSLSTFFNPVHENLLEMERCIESIRKNDSNNFSEMLDHSLDSGGKRIRPTLTFLSGEFYRNDVGQLVPMAASVELLHTAALVHDDVIDKSAIRHGRPTVNNVWSEDKAIIFGDYLIAKAGELCASTGNTRIGESFSRTLGMMSIGEMDQALNAFNLKQSREQYLDRISKKTASLFMLATESGAILSQAPEQSIEILKGYGYNLGIAFQIVDDILDVTGNEQELGKPIGSDLTRGILTLPVLLILERYPKENTIQRLFENHSDQEENQRVIEIIRNSSIIEECHNIVASYRDKACQNLALLPTSASHKVLTDIADYIVRPRI
jgi:octaprenyl-diphosphate synthase